MIRLIVVHLLTAAILIFFTPESAFGSSYQEEFKIHTFIFDTREDELIHNKMPLIQESVDKTLADFSQSSDKPIMIYVHGRGNEPKKSINYRTDCEIGTDYSVNFLMFNWDSFCPICRPVSRAERAAPDLLKLLIWVSEFKNKQKPKNRFVLLAHSMGTIVLEAMTEIRGWEEALAFSENRLFDTVVLTGADADERGHAEWVGKLNRLSDRIFITVNENDGILDWSEGWFARRLGKRFPEKSSVASNANYVVLTGLIDDTHRVFPKSNQHKQENVCKFFDAVLTGSNVNLPDLSETSKPPEYAPNVYKLKKSKAKPSSCFKPQPGHCSISYDDTTHK
ncbi:MAG: alpha/beta hydrolase [Rhodospirillales bacterium]|nr:alpha/beta hydrolase [Rhodospirillales bacterium]